MFSLCHAAARAVVLHVLAGDPAKRVLDAQLHQWPELCTACWGRACEQA